MNFFSVMPSPILRNYVRYFWVLECNQLPTSPYVYRSLADGCAEFVFHYKGIFTEIHNGADNLGSSSLALFHAPSQRFRRFETTESFGIFGAYLYPNAISELFSIPSSELSNQMPDFCVLAGKEGYELEEKIISAPDNSSRILLLTKYLENLVKSLRKVDIRIAASIKYIIDSQGKTNTRDLADKVCLSPRQFERKFKEHAGFNPKLYNRIIRFQAATMEYQRSNKSLTEIAFDCGYYDQSHFIHDFKEFSGYHPSQYFAGKGEGMEYLNPNQ